MAKIPEESLKYVVDFGSHKGETLGWIWMNHPTWFDWVYENIKPSSRPELFKHVMQFLSCVLLFLAK